MEKPVQWMTLLKLREELERTRMVWESTDLDDLLADGQPPALSQDAQRHQMKARWHLLRLWEHDRTLRHDSCVDQIRPNVSLATAQTLPRLCRIVQDLMHQSG